MAEKADEARVLTRLDIIEIVDPPHWAGCLAVVDEVKPWGVQAYVTVPEGPGKEVSLAYIRLKPEQYFDTGGKALVDHT